MGLPVSWWIVIGLIAAVGVQEIRVQTKKVDVQECKNEQAATQILGYKLMDQTQRAWISGSEGIVGWETRALSARESDLRTANISASRLRDRIATLKLTAAHCTAPPRDGEDVGATDPSGLLSVMSDRIDEAAGVYAQIADARRDVGLSCEQRYELIRTGKVPPGDSARLPRPTNPEGEPGGTLGSSPDDGGTTENRNNKPDAP